MSVPTLLTQHNDSSLISYRSICHGIQCAIQMSSLNENIENESRFAISDLAFENTIE